MTLRKPIQTFFLNRNLIQLLGRGAFMNDIFTGLTSSTEVYNLHSFSQTSSHSDWFSKGISLFKMSQYSTAEKCFHLALNTDMAFVSDACNNLSLICAQENSKKSNERSISSVLVYQAAFSLMNVKLYDLVARSLELIGDQKCLLLAARLLASVGDNVKAAGIYVKYKAFAKAAELYTKTEMHPELYECLLLGNRYDELLFYLREHNLNKDNLDKYYIKAAHQKLSDYLLYSIKDPNGSSAIQAKDDAVSYLLCLNDIETRFEILRKFKFYDILGRCLEEQMDFNEAIQIYFYELNDIISTKRCLSRLEAFTSESRITAYLVFKLKEDVITHSFEDNFSYVSALHYAAHFSSTCDIKGLDEIRIWYELGNCSIGCLFITLQILGIATERNSNEDYSGRAYEGMRSLIISLCSKIVDILNSAISGKFINESDAYQIAVTESWCGLSRFSGCGVERKVSTVSPLFLLGDVTFKTMNIKQKVISEHSSVVNSVDAYIIIKEQILSILYRTISDSFDALKEISKNFYPNSRECREYLGSCDTVDEEITTICEKFVITPDYMDKDHSDSNISCLFKEENLIENSKDQHRLIKLDRSSKTVLILTDNLRKCVLLFELQSRHPCTMKYDESINSEKQAKYICSLFWMHIYYLVPDCNHLKSVSRYNLMVLNGNEILTEDYKIEEQMRIDGTLKMQSFSIPTLQIMELKKNLNISDMKSLKYLSTLSLFYQEGEGFKDYQDALQLVYFVTHYLGYTSRKNEKIPLIQTKSALYLEYSSFDDETICFNRELVGKVDSEFKMKVNQSRGIRRL